MGHTDDRPRHVIHQRKRFIGQSEALQPGVDQSAALKKNQPRIAANQQARPERNQNAGQGDASPRWVQPQHPVAERVAEQDGQAGNRAGDLKGDGEAFGV